MKESFLKKIIIFTVLVTTITSSTPLIVSAETTTSITSSSNAGWAYDNGKWYYYDNSGIMQTGVIQVNGGVYCFDQSGAMEFGQVIVNNQTYNTCIVGGNILGDSPKVDKVFDANNNLVADNNQVSLCEFSINVQGLPELPKTYSTYLQTSAEDKVLELMNAKRVEAGLVPLALDNTLVTVARYKSSHMIQYDYFDHTNPDGTQWTNWLQTLGYSSTATAENIVYNTSDPFEFFNQWWNSPGHKANMMNPAFTKVGIGVVQGNGAYVGTQEFSN